MYVVYFSGWWLIFMQSSAVDRDSLAGFPLKQRLCYVTTVRLMSTKGQGYVNETPQHWMDIACGAYRK